MSPPVASLSAPRSETKLAKAVWTKVTTMVLLLMLVFVVKLGWGGPEKDSTAAHRRTKGKCRSVLAALTNTLPCQHPD